ncbi:MAG: hypothetical protein HQK54_14270 [Oligoflexales bacterium]|nr:hypothetical protein [Oligoflexales bacterium]
MKATVVITCSSGIESLLANELLNLGVECNIFCQGVVISCKPVTELQMMKLIMGSRLAHGVGWMIFASDVVSELQAITEVISALDLSLPVYRPAASFGVKARRSGSHSFNSVELAAAVAMGLGKAWSHAGISGIKGSLKDPDFYVQVTMENDRLVVASMMTGEPCGHRLKPVFHHPASLDPTLAAAMITLLSPADAVTLVDPMCGGGTILWEAARMGRGLPPLLVCDEKLPLTRQTWFDDSMYQKWRELRIACERSVQRCKWKISGIETDADIALGAYENLRQFGVSEDVHIHVGDGSMLEGLENEKIDLIVVNPPYGVRMLNPQQSDRLCRRMADSAMERGVVHVLAISQRKGPLTRAFQGAGYQIQELKQVRFGEMIAFICCFCLDKKYVHNSCI